jgi:hypothetical protein
MRLPQLPPDALPQMGEVEATVSALSEPVHSTWCMARVAALLNPYYEKDTPQMVREMEAEDWLEALSPFPQWAIERAVRWWKSAENADRRKKPLEGDIAARCKVEMRGIGAIPSILSRMASRSHYEFQHPPAPERLTADRAAQIMAEVGFRPKKFGGPSDVGQ